MKTSLIIAAAFIALAGLALLAVIVLKMEKSNQLINVSFDELKNMENRER